MTIRPHFFENIEIGQELLPYQQTVDDHFANSFAFAVEDYSEIFTKNGPKTERFVQSSSIAKRLMHLYMLASFDPQGIKAVHLKEDIEFLRPIPFGSTVLMRGRCVDKFVRKGRPMVTLISEAFDANGELLVRQRSLEIVPARDASALVESESVLTGDVLSARRVSGIAIETGARIGSLSEFKGGQAILPELPKRIHQDQIGVFCGAEEGWKNLHTSVEIAEAAGFRRPIMSGLIHVCWYAELLERCFGRAVSVGGRLGAAFLKPVEAGSHVTCHAQIVLHTDTGRQDQYQIELWSSVGEQLAATGFAVVTIEKD